MQATEFEFRHRFWVIGGIFSLSFQAYIFDHKNIVQAIVDWWIPRGGPAGSVLAHALFGFGALLTLLTAVIRTWAEAYLGADVVQDGNLHSNALVADGPYRHVRNPLYLGNILLAAGMGLLASRSGFMILIMGMILFTLRLTAREEAQLEKQQGERFREFCRRVPRLLPSLSPRLPSGGLKPRWAQAFAGETFMWLFFIGMLVFTITLKILLCWILIGAGIGVHILLNWLRQRRKRAGAITGLSENRNQNPNKEETSA